MQAKGQLTWTAGRLAGQGAREMRHTSAEAEHALHAHVLRFALCLANPLVQQAIIKAGRKQNESIWNRF